MRHREEESEFRCTDTLGVACKALGMLVLVGVFILLLTACPSSGPPAGHAKLGSSSSSGASSDLEASGLPSDGNIDLFKERATKLGLDFVHYNGSFGDYHVAEITCGGGAFLDYDGDGDLDVYLAQGAELGAGSGPRSEALQAGASSDRLFRNELVPVGALGFVDATVSAGLDGALGYGCGAATGDFDHDGHVDLLILNLGANQLLRNRGDGTFEDVTARVAPGLAENRSSVAAAFFDFDRDGWLDLIVGNYVTFDFENPPHCADHTGAPDYCGPTAFANEGDQLFHNLGPAADGRVTFDEVTVGAGLNTVVGPTLGLVTADFNGDGWPDIYTANDGQPNHLWINQSGQRFVNEALLTGTGVDASGAAQGSMGVDAGDVDGDGDLDLFMTHLIRETNTLYLNDGQGYFADRTLTSGLGPASLSFTSFGTGFFDYDNDGWLDLLVASGAVTKLASVWKPGGDQGGVGKEGFPLDLPNQLFHNVGGDRGLRLEEVTARAGAAFEWSEVSRGAAFGDVDNDGDTDILVINNDGPARLLINSIGHRNHWLGLRLVGGPPDRPARDQLGARVAVTRKSGGELWRRARSDGGYNAAHDPRVLVGLGDDPRFSVVRVFWPDGSVEEWDSTAVDRYTTLIQGQGRPAAIQ